MKEYLRKNPWLGLQSYKEGEVLYGRDEDIRDLSHCVLNDTDTLLYGKSGIGKSSILNAGILPAARRLGYLPIIIRLSHNDSLTYIQQINQAIIGAILCEQIDIDTDTDESHLESKIFDGIDKSLLIREVTPCKNIESESFYEYFHRHTFHNIKGDRIKLLIIFDQFEEIFTLQDDIRKKKLFFSDLADLLNDIMPNDLQVKVDFTTEFQEEIKEDDLDNIFDDLNLGIENNIPRYVFDNNIHFVFTIREDFLSEFEYYSATIPSLKHNRYNLRPLNEEQAAQIILRPIPEIIDKSVAKLIIEKITGKKDFNIDGIPEIEVDAAVLSLYLNRLYDASEGLVITQELVEQKGGEIISDFYKDALSEISVSSIEYLEEVLLNGQGRRENITIYDAINKGNVSEYEINVLCNKKKVLRQFNYAGDLRIEYVHDILCPIVEKHKEEKITLKIQAKSRKRILYLVLLLIFTIVSTIILVGNNNHLKELNEELVSKQEQMLKSHQKLLSLKISQLLDNDDSYTARKLFLNALSIVPTGDKDSLSDSFCNILRRMSNNNNAILKGHISSVVDVAYSPTEPLIASVSDTTVIIWNETNGQILKKLYGHSDNILSVTFSPDGKKLVTASNDKEIRVYDISTGIECYPPLKGHNGGVRLVIFTPDGRRIVSASKDKSICVWNSENGQLLNQYSQVHNDEILFLAFSADYSKFASASADKKIKIWDTKTGSLISVLDVHKDWVRSVCFNPLNNEQLVSASDDGTIRIWNLKTNTDVVLHKANCYVTRAIYSSDGKNIIASYRDGTVRVWDVNSKTENIYLQGSHKSYVNAVDISPDGNRFASVSADMSVRLWDLNSKLIVDEKKDHEQGVLHTATNGKYIVSVGDDRNIICYDIYSTINKPVWVKSIKDRKFQKVAINPKKDIVALVGYKIILILDLLTGEICNSIEDVHKGWIYGLDTSPDGKYIVTSDISGNIAIWDWDLNLKNYYENCHNGSIVSVKYNYDGSRIVSASSDHSVKIWNVLEDSNNVEIKIFDELDGHSGDVLYATFSKDGKSILSCSRDKTARIWNLETNRYEIFSGHGGSVNYATFGCNNNEIVTVSSDHLVRVWNVKTQQVILTLYEHKGSVTSVLFDDATSNIITSSWDNTIKIWKYPSIDDIIEEIYSRFGDYPLNEDELRELEVL